MTRPAKNDEKQRLDRLEELFFAALQRPRERRAEYLDQACGGDAPLRAEVERMLRADQDRSKLIDAPPWGAEPLARRLTSSDDEDPIARPGARIGRYRLIERIGLGGMGTVWRAERADGNYERRVALKIVKRGLDTDDILQRFRRERQVLAQLEHPNIARLYDGGATEDGRPYLVMECVDGLPIDKYCAAQALSVDQRLHLFREVCLTVHYAHSNLVLHRDLKPSNIPVTAERRPKLLDFGIAKVLDAGGAAATAQTTAESRLLTPRYASPEQVRGERLTTATDTYSLGVVLYELLTGQSPYKLETGTRREIERAILSQDASRPSRAVLQRADLAALDRRRLRRRLRGDLDNILTKALHKDPAERYQSAQELAEDIRRHLEGLPLLARPAGVIRRGLRGLRRNRRSLAVAAVAAVAALTVSTTAMTYLFMAPRWARQHVRQARTALLHPDISNRVWIEAFYNLGAAPGPPSEITGNVALALTEYDAALRLARGDERVRQERYTVWLAAAISRGPAALEAVPDYLRRVAPLTCEYAVAWTRDGVAPPLSDEQLTRAGDADLRCLGLLNVLCRNIGVATQALAQRGNVQADPLIESMLGVLYLALDQPQRAYPRLLSAFREYPQSGLVCTYLADAAFQCGDVALAGRLLERLERLEGLDPLGAHDRVQVNYYLAVGQEQQAAELFNERCARMNPIAEVQYARHLFDSGRRRDALGTLAVSCGPGTSYPRVPERTMAEFFVLTQRWWGELDASQRLRVLYDSLSDSPREDRSLWRILTAYRTSVERVVRSHRELLVPRQAAASRPPPEWDNPVHRELVELYDRLEIRDADRWSRFRSYPAPLRAFQVLAWHLPASRSISRLIAATQAAWHAISGPDGELLFVELPTAGR